jgi:cutinase
MHLATEQIPESLYPRIKALVMFGDPQLRRNGTFPAALQPKVLQNCAPGDPVCEEGAPCFYYHLVYIFPEWIDPSVEFIVHALNSTKCSLSTHWDSSQLA